LIQNFLSHTTLTTTQAEEFTQSNKRLDIKIVLNQSTQQHTYSGSTSCNSTPAQDY